ncbi:MAG: hypothetical protein R3B48_15600 [Kofleriaceae bacterium]
MCPARSADHFDLTISLHLHDRRRFVVSTPSFIAIADLYRLRDYLKDHLRALQSSPDAQSFVFTPLELGFQLQALGGEVRAPNDGECTVRLMVQVASGEDHPRLYVGCESGVTAAAMRAFIAQLDAIVAAAAS